VGLLWLFPLLNLQVRVLGFSLKLEDTHDLPQEGKDIKLG
jgi:hypothetical protein